MGLHDTIFGCRQGRYANRGRWWFGHGSGAIRRTDASVQNV